MAQVFLSYARSDVDRAKALAAAIERDGFSVWWDRDLEGGAEYSREIDDALKAAQVVVVLWSKESVASAWVRDEAAAGRDSGRLVPVRLDSAEAPLGFRQYQTIDLARWNGHSNSAGLKTLKKAIAAKVGRGKAAALPDGHKDSQVPSRSRLLPGRALVAGLIVLALAALGYLWFARQADAGIPTVAIVGAPDAADRAGSASMARDLAIDIGGLRDASADTFELKDATRSPDAIDFVVSVSSAQRGAAEAADLTLTSSSSAQVLWTGHYEGGGDTGALRPQVATRVATLLACLGQAKSPSAPSLDEATVQLFLRGCERIEERVGGRVEAELISLFRQVTERAPKFAPGWANLAWLEVTAGVPGRPERGLEKKAREHLRRAKELDPTLGLAYLAEAGLLGYDRWEERIPLLEEGLRRDPDNADLHAAKSIDLRQAGYLNEAVDSAMRAAELNPLSARVQTGVVPILSAAGRVEEARERLGRAERLWPGVPVVSDARYAFDLRYGDPARALAMLRRDPSRSASGIASTGLPNPAVERFLEARIDPTPARIEAAAAAYIERWRKDPSTIDIPSLVTLGKIDLAYQALQNPVTLKAYASISGVFFRAPLHEFRKDPRFMPLVARLGLVRYWKKTGKWPDYCLDADLPYDCKREAAKYR